MGDSLKKGLFILFSATFISKIVGFVRELVIASKFGVSEEFDVFLTIFAIPTTIVSLFLYAVPHIVIPRLNLNQKSQAKFYKTFSEQYFWGFILLLLVVATLYLLFSYFYLLINPIKAFEKHTGLIFKLLLLFGIYIFFNSIYAILKALYNAKQKFLLPAFSPLLIHISVIFSILVFYKHGVITFAWGLVIGGIIQLILYFFNFKKENIIQYFKFSIKPNKLQYSSYFIILFIELLGQSYMLIDRFFIDKLPKGHISAMHYAGILNNLPVTIIGMSVGTLLFPKMTQLIQKNKIRILKYSLAKAFIILILTGVLIFVIFKIFGGSIISILFERGRFEEKAVLITKDYLSFLSFGLPFILVHIILAKLCFALHREKVLLISTILAVILKFLLSSYFIKQFFFQGLALSTSIAFFFNVLIVIGFLYKPFYRRKLLKDG